MDLIRLFDETDFPLLELPDDIILKIIGYADNMHIRRVCTFFVSIWDTYFPQYNIIVNDNIIGMRFKIIGLENKLVGAIKRVNQLDSRCEDLSSQRTRLKGHLRSLKCDNMSLRDRLNSIGDPRITPRKIRMRRRNNRGVF